MFTKIWDDIVFCVISQTEGTVKTQDGYTRTLYPGLAAGAIKLGSTEPAYNIATLKHLAKWNANANAGVFLGTGDTPASYEDFSLDEKLTSAFDYLVTFAQNNVDGGVELVATYTITNTGAEAFTVREIGMFVNVSAGNNYHDTYKSMIERTVLDNPVTIEPSGIGQITYKIRVMQSA